MNTEIHFHPIQVHYDDTDATGLVYHANYLRYFEHARNNFVGMPELARLNAEGVLFAIPKVEVTYREGARFGDHLVVRTRAQCQNEFRLRFFQDVLREGEEKVKVAGVVDLVCIDRNHRLMALPAPFLTRFA